MGIDTSCIHIIQCTRWCSYLTWDLHPCYYPWHIHPTEGSPTWPKFKARKSITQHPVAGLGGTSYEGLGRSDRQFTGYRCLGVRVHVVCICCVYILALCVCVLVCAYVCVVCAQQNNFTYRPMYTDPY